MKQKCDICGLELKDDDFVALFDHDVTVCEYCYNKALEEAEIK